MSANMSIWTSAGWRTQQQISTLRDILLLTRERRDDLYVALCDRIKKGNVAAAHTMQDLLAEPLFDGEAKDDLRAAYNQAFSPGNLPYGAFSRDDDGRVNVMQFQRGLDGSFAPV